MEVAGIGSLQHNIIHPGDTDEVEENATDLAAGQDYPHLVAMRAPRATLPIHDAEDECCFRAALAAPTRVTAPDEGESTRFTNR